MSKINWPSENYLVTPEDTRGAAKCGVSGAGTAFSVFFFAEELQLENESESKRNNPTRSL